MAGTLVIVGAGGHGRVCAEVAKAAGFEVVGFCDSAMSTGQTINGITVIGAEVTDAAALETAKPPQIFVAVGDNERRLALLDQGRKLGLPCARLIHPSAVLSPSCEIGEGTVVVAGAIVNANAVIGRGCILNTACSLDHDNVLDDGVQICPGAHAAGGVTFGAQAFVGTGASIIPNIAIGARAIVAAGAVVTADVPEGASVAGVPAQAIARGT
jgi:sugar O-acyltransferase (sialic acid O-acetyltransferase NeuD family)